MASIAVIGAGVVGLSTAVVLQRTMPWINVTVITDRLSPETTGDGSAGFWEPYLLGETPADKILHWSKRSYDLFRDLWKSSVAGHAGVSLIPVVYVTQEANQHLPHWRHAVMGFSEMNEKEILYYNTKSGQKYKSGFHFISFTCEPTMFLPMLLEEFKKRGGTLQHRCVSSLAEFADSTYDVIVNSTGLQARFLVPDLNMHPIRGQVMRVKAPWTFHCFMDDSENGCYVIPNHDSVVLGGTKQEDWKLEVDSNDTKSIHSACCSMLPDLKAAPIIREWVGLRPGRYQVRLERETRRLPNGQKLEIVHNYGHGGAGVTLSWGCAEEATSIISEILKEMTPKAKL